MFHFVVRRLRWVAHLPLAAHFFDAVLLGRTALVDPPRLQAMEALELAALRLPDMTLCLHRYGGTGFARNGQEFAHLHGNGLLDVRLTTEVAVAQVRVGRGEPHHFFGPSAWISFWVRSQTDLDMALDLIAQGARLSSASQRCPSLRVL